MTIQDVQIDRLRAERQMLTELVKRIRSEYREHGTICGMTQSSMDGVAAGDFVETASNEQSTPCHKPITSYCAQLWGHKGPCSSGELALKPHWCGDPACSDHPLGG